MVVPANTDAGVRHSYVCSSAPLYRSEREILFRAESLSPLRAIDMGARPVEDLSRFHHRFRQGWMRMNGKSDVLCQRGHFNRDHALGDKFPRSDTNNPDT